jgi:hypothetical protein
MALDGRDVIFHSVKVFLHNISMFDLDEFGSSDLIT